MTARTWRLLAGLVVVVVLALVAPQLVGDGSGDGSSGSGSGSSSTATGGPQARAGTGDTSGLPTVAVADLPPEAAEVLDAIDAGGPFTSPRDDGGVFGNREGLLPPRPSGYYREYTVPTPGEDDRGARRIVTGGDPVEVFWWTDDHYDSFSVIAR